ncbi:MAG: phosphoethanolamine--lipid A transferase, partial [Thiotrichaceae bacterium]|nr:phosphoethanolamine--lipid A transferase [Thiotrichaceae bacterium]
MKISITRLTLFLSIFLTLFDNWAYYQHVLEIYPAILKNSGFLMSIVILQFFLTNLILILINSKYIFKPAFILILFLSASAAYFMDSYNAIIDGSMINNILSTDVAEASDLFSFKLLGYLFFLAVLPTYFIAKTTVPELSLWQSTISRLKLLGFSVLMIVLIIYIFSNFYSSFFREHKSIRFYSNPLYYIYSSSKYMGKKLMDSDQPLKEIGVDAHIPSTDTHRELIIFVVGETARADRFSLNGYSRETNPLLKKEDVISLTNFWSCGTSTAVSVPCMFFIVNTSEFDIGKTRSTENVLDVLKHAGVNLIWLDNNSSSKGVADRIDYQSYKGSDINTECDLECRDIGMLENLQAYIDGHPQGDIFIVLHQMGQHGPAYYKRYPSEFEKFTPVCKTNQLENCSNEELNNTYDNAILYTDYFLSKTIKLLKRNDAAFETAMFYVSDHGESLGENGLYLHGLPNFIAPDSQRHVPAIIFLGKNMVDDIDLKEIKQDKSKRYSHDNLF